VQISAGTDQSLTQVKNPGVQPFRYQQLTWHIHTNTYKPSQNLISCFLPTSRKFIMTIYPQHFE